MRPLAEMATKPCPNCGGTGKKTIDQLFSRDPINISCPACEGKGTVKEEPNAAAG